VEANKGPKLSEHQLLCFVRDTLHLGPHFSLHVKKTSSLLFLNNKRT